MKSDPYVLNSKGEKEPFSYQKVYRSAKRVGASDNLAGKIAETIQEEAYPGIKTFEIFKRVKELLDKELPHAALKFDLKRAMRKLGPAGFHFEKYISEIFSREGFETKINQYISGKCARYEIDFVSQKNNLFYFGECKYRNLAGDKVDLNVCLINYARFLDIKNGNYFKDKKLGDKKIKPIIVTNAKFTSQAVKYSKCQGTELLGWNYPKNKGLEYLIDNQKLYPITILPSFKGFLMNIFVEERMMLAQDILRFDMEKFSKKFKIPIKYLNPLIKEAELLLK